MYKGPREIKKKKLWVSIAYGPATFCICSRFRNPVIFICLLKLEVVRALKNVCSTSVKGNLDLEWCSLKKIHLKNTICEHHVLE